MVTVPPGPFHFSDEKKKPGNSPGLSSIGVSAFRRRPTGPQGQPTERMFDACCPFGPLVTSKLTR
jgi:hypothetical protein